MNWRDSIGILLVCVPIGMALGAVVIAWVTDKESRDAIIYYGTVLLMLASLTLGLYLVTT